MTAREGPPNDEGRAQGPPNVERVTPTPPNTTTTTRSRRRRHLIARYWTIACLDRVCVNCGCGHSLVLEAEQDEAS